MLLSLYCSCLVDVLSLAVSLSRNYYRCRCIVTTVYSYSTVICCCRVISCIVTISITVLSICCWCFVAHFRWYFVPVLLFMAIFCCSRAANSNNISSLSFRCLVLILLSFNFYFYHSLQDRLSILQSCRKYFCTKYTLTLRM